MTTPCDIKLRIADKTLIIKPPVTQVYSGQIDSHRLRICGIRDKDSHHFSYKKMFITKCCIANCVCNTQTLQIFFRLEVLEHKLKTAVLTMVRVLQDKGDQLHSYIRHALSKVIIYFCCTKDGCQTLCLGY